MKYFAIGFLMLVFSDVMAQTPAIVDSSLYAPDWQPRSVELDGEEVQRRNDRQAELEETRKRYRAMRKAADDNKKANGAADEENLFLWAEDNTPPTAVQHTSVDTMATAPIAQQVIQDEISRNLQYKASDASSHSGAMPSSYDEPYVAAAARPLAGSPELQLYTGQVVVVEKLQKIAGQEAWAPEAVQELDYWHKVLLNNPNLVVEWRAHAPLSMERGESLQWTTQRAREIADYFLTRGITERQVRYRGYGNMRPLVLDSTAEANQKNSRIELIILEMPQH